MSLGSRENVIRDKETKCHVWPRRSLSHSPIGRTVVPSEELLSAMVRLKRRRSNICAFKVFHSSRGIYRIPIRGVHTSSTS